jgi:hypothetical protein
MAHFAELNNVNIVLRVLVVHNNELMVDGVESEDRGIKFLQSLLGAGTVWKQTSYNNNMRGKFAGIGYVYNLDTDEFLTPEEAAELGLPVAESAPVTETVIEPAAVVETVQIQINLDSVDIPALTSGDVIALSSEQITGL